jgi:hypothetical protein
MGLGTDEEPSYRTGPPAYVAWWSNVEELHKLLAVYKYSSVLGDLLTVLGLPSVYV